MNLELKQIVPYLPYQLKIKTDKMFKGNPIMELSHENVYNKLSLVSFLLFQQKNYKPILIPLSDFADINSKKMCELNFDISTQIDLNELAIKYKHYTSCYYTTANACFENHIDIFGLIDKGLAISVHDVVQADA